jgi:hypothetical protein
VLLTCGSFTSKPASRAEQDQVRAWLAQIRQECGVRLCEQIFAADPKKPSKFWMAFKAKKFMNKVRQPCQMLVLLTPRQTLYDEGKK